MVEAFQAAPPEEKEEGGDGGSGKGEGSPNSSAPGQEYQPNSNNVTMGGPGLGLIRDGTKASEVRNSRTPQDHIIVKTIGGLWAGYGKVVANALKGSTAQDSEGGGGDHVHPGANSHDVSRESVLREVTILKRLAHGSFARYLDHVEEYDNKSGRSTMHVILGSQSNSFGASSTAISSDALPTPGPAPASNSLISGQNSAAVTVTLEHLLSLPSPPRVEQIIVEWVGMMLSAVTHLHRNWIIHRDIKPAVFLLSLTPTTV